MPQRVCRQSTLLPATLGLLLLLWMPVLMPASSGSSEHFAAGDTRLNFTSMDAGTKASIVKVVRALCCRRLQAFLTFTDMDACLRLASSILTSPVVRLFSSLFLPLFSIFYLVLAPLASPSSSSSSFGGSARVFLHWELAERAVLGFKFFASSRECSGVMNALFSVVVFCFYASCGVAVG